MHIFRFETEKEVVKLANNTRMGLAGKYYFVESKFLNPSILL